MRVQAEAAKYSRKEWIKFNETWNGVWNTLENENHTRQFKQFSVQGSSALSDAKLAQVTKKSL